MLLAGAILADMPDTIALVQERDARTVRMSHREITQAQPINPPTAAETAAVQMAEAAKNRDPQEAESIAAVQAGGAGKVRKLRFRCALIRHAVEGLRYPPHMR